jgi:hypothetical protein
MIRVLYVPLDDFCTYSTHTTIHTAPAPQRFISLKRRMVLPDIIGSPALKYLNHLPHREVRRARNKQMHMIIHDLLREQADIMPLANPIDSLYSQIMLVLLSKDRTAILRYQHHMIPILTQIMRKPF